MRHRVGSARSTIAVKLRLLIVVLWVIAASAVLHACDGWRQETPPVGIDADFAQRWLARVPCTPPCWEGITPGTSTLTETLALLQRHPAIEPASVHIATIRAARPIDAIEWTWTGGTPGGDIYLDTTGPNAVPQLIGPVFGTIPGIETRVRLEDVIAMFGEPTHIAATAFYDHGHPLFSGRILYTVSLFYQNDGIALLFRPPHDNKPVLDEQLVFEIVEFFDPDAMMVVYGRAEPIIPWEGFQDFTYYCRARAYPPDACDAVARPRSGTGAP